MRIMINHIRLRSRTMLYFFYLSYVVFSENIIEQVLLTYQKLEMNMLQIFKIKYIVNFRKKEVEKKIRFSRVKIVKSNKTEKADQLIAGYQEAKCL